MQVTESKEIDGLVFTVTQLPGMKALKISNQLRRLLGPPLAKIGEISAINTANISVLGEALAALELSDEDLEKLTRTFLESATVTIEGKTGLLMPQFDAVMQGRVWVIYRLLAFALVLNFHDFFAAAQGLFKPAAPMTSEGSKISTTPGPAGASSSKKSRL